MLFESKLPCPSQPSIDVFSYLFDVGRRSYPRDRLIYRVDKSDESLTLEELEQKSRRLANAIVTKYEIKSNDVVAIFAKDRVSQVFCIRMSRHRC